MSAALFRSARDAEKYKATLRNGNDRGRHTIQEPITFKAKTQRDREIERETAKGAFSIEYTKRLLFATSFFFFGFRQQPLTKRLSFRHNSVGAER